MLTVVAGCAPAGPDAAGSAGAAEAEAEGSFFVLRLRFAGGGRFVRREFQRRGRGLQFQRVGGGGAAA